MAEYVPLNAINIAEPCFILADTLIETLRESNGLEFMPLEQRLALVAELLKATQFDDGESS